MWVVLPFWSFVFGLVLAGILGETGQGEQY